MLERIPDEQRRLVLGAAVRRRYQRGAIVFHEGDPGDALHLIDKGRVCVRVSTPLGEVATLTVLGPGDSFGELALVNADNRRTATIEALEPTETLVLNRAAFMEIASRHPSVQQMLVAILADQVDRLSQTVLEALYASAETRVLRRVAHMAQLYGDTEPVEIPLTQEDIASMAGTTRPTANKVLRQGSEQGILELRRGRIVVLDRKRLDRLAR